MERDIVRILERLPDSFLPYPGRKLTLTGLTLEEAKRVVKPNLVFSHIKNEELAQKLTKDLEINVRVATELSPIPYQSASVFLVASPFMGPVSRNKPTELAVVYVLVQVES